jgi:hypothetical protein
MAGLVPAIRVLASDQLEDVDARHKAGHDIRIEATDDEPRRGG